MEDTQDMTATEMDASSTPSSPRLQEFQSEVDKLKVTGGRANPERGVADPVDHRHARRRRDLAHGLAPDPRHHQPARASHDFSAMGVFGLTLTIAATGLFIVMSLRRYFRYWLVRLIFEQREQTDRVLGK